MPVLTEKAVGCATGVKDGKVMLPSVLIAFTHPIGNAVCRQGVAIPMQQATLGGAGQMNQLPLAHCPQAAEAAFAFADRALIAAKPALRSLFMTRRCYRQVKFPSGSGVRGADCWKRLVETGTDASDANPNGLGDQRRSAVANLTTSGFHLYIPLQIRRAGAAYTHPKCYLTSRYRKAGRCSSVECHQTAPALEFQPVAKRTIVRQVCACRQRGYTLNRRLA